MHYLTPDWTNLPKNILGLSTLRSGGASVSPYDDGSGGGGRNLAMHVGDDIAAVMQNRLALNALLPSAPVWLNQVHGAEVVNLDGAVDNIEADAAIATRRNVVCAVQTADCLPVLFADLHGQVVGAAHAGWRGLLAGVLQNTVRHMRAAGAGPIVAWLGPAIGPEKFETGAEVRQAFLEAAQSLQLAQIQSCFVPLQTGKYLADIYQLARVALAQVNVKNIYGGGFCTFTDSCHFYSYRRDRVTGRMATLIWLT